MKNKLRALLAGAALLGLGVSAAVSGPQPGVNSPYFPVWSIPIDSIKWTYGLGFSLSPGVSATDIFQLCGDPLSTLVTRITRIAVNGRATVPNQVPIFIVKRTSPTQGGLFSVEWPFFSATTVGVPYDTTNANPGRSTAAAWINAGTLPLGTNVPAFVIGLSNTTQGGGIIAAGQLDLSQTVPGVTFDWGNRPTQAPILRNGQQCIAVNLSNSTNTGNLFDFQVEWTEE